MSETRDGTFDVRAQRRLSGLGLGRLILPRRRPDTHGTTPVVERIEHVRLAELDAHRPSARPPGLQALTAPVDAAKRNLQRHACRGPAAHHLEGRSDDANEMAAVLLTQVSLHLPCVLPRIGHGWRFLSQISRSPSSVRSASTCCTASVSAESTGASPPVAITIDRSTP